MLDYTRQLQEACRELATAIAALIDGSLPSVLDLSIIHPSDITILFSYDYFAKKANWKNRIEKKMQLIFFP